MCAEELGSDDVLERVTEAVRTQVMDTIWGRRPGGLKDLVRQITQDGTPFVMLIENIDAWVDSSEGVRMLCALKAIRDATNLPPGHGGKFLLVGIGASPKMIALTQDRSQAFYGAVYLTLADQHVRSTAVDL
jgi:hypothetical protein